MSPKKKGSVVAAKAAATSPSSAHESMSSVHLNASTPLSKVENERRRSQSVSEAAAAAAATPKGASLSQPLRTPERQRSHSIHTVSTPSPAVPPAPAATPVPLPDRTPRRERSRSASSGNNTTRQSKSELLSLSTSPVPPPPPPSSPVPVAQRLSSQQQQQPGTPSKKKNDRAASAQENNTPASAKKKTPSAAVPATSVPTSPKKKEEKSSVAAAVVAEAGSIASAKAEKQPTGTLERFSCDVRRRRSRRGEGESVSLTAHAVEGLIRESKVIAPDVSGLRCLAVHPSEQQVVVARENGSLVLYDVSFFQNIPQFVQRRHTGGQTRRTITSLAYVAVPAPASASSIAATRDTATTTRYVLLASMMSGQIVVYDAELLVPVALHQRSGGAVWQLTVVGPACVYAAMADSSWQQLRLTCRRDGAAPQLELVRVVPGISGADRALTVAASLSLRMAVGSDDAGNVHAWRLPTYVGGASSSGGAADHGDGGDDAATRGRGLATHESLWTTKLAKGVALSCAVVGGTPRPCVVVGTSMGDVVLLDAAHGHVFQTFSQHKGPVTTLVVQNDTVVYASGWHESLRSYRCSGEGDWYPAEVKRRTHYHEASQLVLLPQRQLLLSASRDGTFLYAPTTQLFHAPAMYVAVTTQQFAYAAERAVLLQSRFDTIEAFCMDGAGRHWVPFFGHRLDGRFHLSGLWCDAQLHYIVFSTEERAGLLRVVWRTQAAQAIARIEEVLELPARTGVVDVCWGTPASTPQAVEEEDVGKNEEEGAAAARAGGAGGASRVLYVLYDDAVASVTLADGYPVVHTAVQVRGQGLLADSLRPHRVFCRATAAPVSKRRSPTTNTQATDAVTGSSAKELVIYGHRGSCRMQLMADGTPDADTLVADLDDVYELVEELPVLCKQKHSTGSNNDNGDDGNNGADDSRRAKRMKGEATATGVVAAAAAAPPALIGLSATQQRYVIGFTLHSAAAGAVLLSATLPHDVRWIARLPTKSSSSASSAHQYLGYFSRGLLVASGDSWHMVRRMNVEAAFVVKEGTEVLVLERNLEKTLEALPLSWKVRRFGN